MKLVLIGAALLLSGCVDYGQMRTDLGDGIAALKGRNIEVAIDRLGIPAENRPLGDTTVYTWTNANVFTGASLDESPLRCDLRLRADASGTIMSGDYDGNNGACIGLRDKLLAR